MSGIASDAGKLLAIGLGSWIQSVYGPYNQLRVLSFSHLNHSLLQECEAKNGAFDNKSYCAKNPRGPLAMKAYHTITNPSNET